MSSYQKNSYTKIELKGITKLYEGSNILENISLHLEKGELVSIIGPSGCGKSTIFNVITGIIGKEDGELYINGDISYMHQKDLLLPHKTIIDNVALPLQLRGISKKAARDEAYKYFEIFGLAGYEYKYPHELSGGMRQRANFMRTFMTSNDIMLLDEPFGALDYITKHNLIDWFYNVRKKLESSILLITHDIDEAIHLSDRIYILSHRPATVRLEVDLRKENYKDSIEGIDKLKNIILKEIAD